MKPVIHLVGNVSPILAGLITAPLTARSLGPMARGELAIILLVAVFIGLIGALGLGLLARQAVARDLGQAYGWSRRGQRVTLISAAGATAVGILVAQLMNLELRTAIATTVLFTLSGMSASKSIDANILIVAGRTRQFGAANLAASATVCLGIVTAFATSTLTLWTAVGINTASLLMQILFISVSLRRFLTSTVRGELKKESVKSLIGRAWRAWRSQIMEATVTRSDSLLFMTQSTVQIVGYYAVVALIPQIMYQVVQTIIQHSYSAAPTLKLRDRTRLLWQACTLTSIPLAVIAAIAAFLLVPVVFGQEFISSLDLVGPACAVAIGMAGLAPALQHYAVSSTSDRWFPLTLVLVWALGWVTGRISSPALGVVVIGLLFSLLGLAYVLLMSGPKCLRLSVADLRRLFGRLRPDT